MKSQFIECQQGTPEWLAARTGRITASEFSTVCDMVGGLTVQQKTYVDAILSGTPDKEALEKAGYKAKPTSELVKRALQGEIIEKEFSDSAKRYAADIAMERISGVPYGIPPKAWVLERGHIMEAHARRIYESRTGSFVTETGICIDEHGFGYSSDGLVNGDGLIEIKAPIDSLKIEDIFKNENIMEYMHQIQGGMWITGRDWCDLIVYVPALEAVGADLFVKRILRDEAFIEDMVSSLWKFQRLIAEKEEFFRNYASQPLKLAA